MTQQTSQIASGKTGSQYRSEDNDGKRALLNHHKGSAAPSYAEAGMMWIDDTSTPWKLKAYDGADWITIGEINATTNTFTPYHGTARPRTINHATDTGSANAYAIAPVPAITALVVGDIITLKPVNNQTAACTVAVSGLSAVAVKTIGGADPSSGSMTTAGLYILVYDGTNFVLVNPSTAGVVVLKAMGTDVASATTTDLGGANSDYVTVTGTTPITGLGSSTTYNHVWVKFAAALTLTHNGTSLILPTGANITTVAGDVAEFVRISGSNWQCVKYTPVSGDVLLKPLGAKGTSIASATTTDIGAADSSHIQLTGTTTITGLGSTLTRNHLWVYFAGALTLTHNGTSLILPTSANIVTAAGDTAEFVRDSGGNWRCLNYMKANGEPLVGSPIGKHTVWIPAAAMISRTTNGAASGTTEMATNKNMVVTKDFDSATQEFVQFSVAMPKGWNESTVTFIPYWSHAATVTNFGVVWGLEAVAVGDSDAMDVAFGTAQTSTDTGGTTNDIWIGPESSAITIGGSPVENDLVMFQVKRLPADASDTMAVDARLHGIKLIYTINAGTDA